MKRYLALLFYLIITIPVLAQSSAAPHLIKKEATTQLIVKGKPFLILGGELHNSSTSGAAYMRPIWKNMKAKNLNTVIAAAYWELVEPMEGKFDFTLLDSMITGARKEDLHLVILWFGSWKNGYSMYAPAWVKNNTQKYPRAKDAKGNTLQHLSAFGDATATADARAFRAMMQHIRNIDEKEQTVIMVQVQNEVGLFNTPRDYSDAANKAYQSPIPKDLADYISANKGKLQPELDSVLKIRGYKLKGTWEEVFGKSIFDDKNWKTLSHLTEELFTVYHYAKYIGKIAAAGKEAYPLPMYVNAWIKQPGVGGAWPGKYPSGGPTPHTLDIWRAAAPAIDLIVPDIYVPDIRYTVQQYHRPGNAFFIPEVRPGERSAHEAFWAFGQYDIFGYAPFGIDDYPAAYDPITPTYATLQQVKDLILQHQGKGTMAGILVDTVQRIQRLKLGGYTIKAELGRQSNFTNIPGLPPPPPPSVAGGIIIHTGKDEFVVIGKDYLLTFIPERITDKSLRLDVESIEEGQFVNGKWQVIRRLNGDEGTGGGDYGFGYAPPQPAATLRFQKQPDGGYSILKYKIYSYK
ncbi:DUF5597 domain-containing protein [Ohtaekwangia kribbensis]|uniref:DUF5597 domain-containing protein n=1 Tax=Ohtaekwangia kribbensis TaxID=688913 RepID=A0ABW3KE14_9BACT